MKICRQNFNTTENSISFVDIITTLLIFFMLITTVNYSKNNVTVDLPVSNSTLPLNNESLKVIMNKNGDILINDISIPKKEIYKKLKDNKITSLVLYVDKKVTVDYIIDFLNITNTLNISVALAALKA